MEKINLKYHYELNEKSVQNLSNQVDFLNKENEKLQRQVDILKGDGEGNLALDQYNQLKNEMDDLVFENSTLKKDYNEATKLLRQTQNKLIEIEKRDQLR